MIHYPIPIHLQNAYKDMGYMRGAYPAAEKISECELSIPLYPGLTNEQIEYIINAINEFDYE